MGLALARLLANNGRAVTVACREEDGPAHLRDTRESPYYLPGMKLPESVQVTKTPEPEYEGVLYAVPSHVMRQACETVHAKATVAAVTVAKGIERKSLKCMSDIVAEFQSCPVVALSGPSHAEELARDLPASVVAACADETAAVAVQQAFTSASFRVYTSTDVIGVELGGALKNVIAIAAGVSDGLGLGDNAKAALITRGLAEISRLGHAMGADPLTFAGLSGMGDLIVTCASGHSRNRRVGMAIAKGMSAEEAMGGSHMIAEGVRNAEAAHALAQKYQVDMPICRKVYAVLFQGEDPTRAIQDLMQRDPKPERA